MPRSRPASNPVSYHKYTGQYYVTRAGKRIYLGSDRDQALRRYHEIGLGVEMTAPEGPPSRTMTLKELANRFIATQRANWRSPEATLKCYTGWLGRLLADHSGRKAGVPCHGFYRLRHCASTAMSLVASPHVQRKFMRHSQIQQQVTYQRNSNARSRSGRGPVWSTRWPQGSMRCWRSRRQALLLWMAVIGEGN